MQSSTYKDLILTGDDIIKGVITFIIVFFVFSVFSLLKYGKRRTSLFSSALFLKFLCTFSFVYLTKYVIGGDSLMYYTGARQIALSDWSSLQDFIFTYNPHNWSLKTYSNLEGSPLNYFHGLGNSMVGRFGALSILFLFDSFISVSLCFAFFAFIGCLKFYKVAVSLYFNAPKFLPKLLLFLPSLLYWSNGLLKDALCLGFLGIAVESIYKLVYSKRGSKLISYLSLFCCLFFLISIKSYIAISLLMAFSLSFSFKKIASIKNRSLKLFVIPIVALFLVIGVVLSTSLLDASDFNQFSPSNIMNTIERHQSVTFGESTYSLGDFDGSFVSVIMLFPSAIIVSLFRPFLWEVHNFLMLLLSMENLFIFGLTLFVFFKIGFFKGMGYIRNDSFLILCFLFTLIFGGVVGLSTYNFGNLARYRLPMLPFYFILLMGLYHYHIERKKQRT